MTAYFVSDLHLVDMEDERTQLFLHFLRTLPEETTHLFLVGDIFDLWIGRHKFFIDRFQPVLTQLKIVKAKNIEVHYFEGNHDLYLRPYFESQLNLMVHEGPKDFSLGQTKLRVEHGDQMDPDDRGYLFLRWFLRTELMRKVAFGFPEKWICQIGSWASQKSRKYTSEVKTVTSEQSREKIRRYAKQQSQQGNGFDLLVAGHVHIRDDFEFEQGGRSVRAINLGTWLREPIAFRLDENGGSWVSIAQSQ